LAPTTATAFAQQILDEPLKTPDGVTSPRLVVAIDPGHGGRDPGAQTDHVDEADLVLTFALKLRDALLRTGQADVILTRDEDQFVSLDGRLTKARDAKANVFLSIHADALAKDTGEASGITVYSLSQSATERADLRLRERHGDDDILTGVDLSGSGDDVAEALLSLARQDTYPRTQALSASIVDAFMAGGLELNARPEREGDLAVLKAADIPSVLVELGFLSTDADLERLSSDIWQENAATALGNAVLLWFEEDQMTRAFRP
jgi:N-acetylmuramoyl-L-alanine amidase